MSLTRHARVHISSPDGMHYSTTVKNEDGSDLPFPVAAIDWHCEPGQVAKAHVTCYLARLDVLTDAEMELHTAEMLRLESILAQMTAFLRQMVPQSRDRDDLIARAMHARLLAADEDYVTVEQRERLAEEWRADLTAAGEAAEAAPAGATIPD